MIANLVCFVLGLYAGATLIALLTIIKHYKEYGQDDS